MYFELVDVYMIIIYFPICESKSVKKTFQNLYYCLRKLPQLGGWFVIWISKYVRWLYLFQ